MQKLSRVLCRSCRTLATPICECGLLATKQSDIALVVYSDDLSLVSFTNVWEDSYGILLWIEETDLLSKAKLSKISDIHFTKD